MTVHKVKLNKNYSWFIQTLAVVPGDILLYESKDANGHFVTRYVYVVMDGVFMDGKFLRMNLLTSENKIRHISILIKQ